MIISLPSALTTSREFSRPEGYLKANQSTARLDPFLLRYVLADRFDRRFVSAGEFSRNFLTPKKLLTMIPYVPMER
jgi:hypothetical protein